MSAETKDSPRDLLLWTGFFVAMVLFAMAIPIELLERKLPPLRWAFVLAFLVVFGFWLWRAVVTKCHWSWRLLAWAPVLFCIIGGFGGAVTFISLSLIALVGRARLGENDAFATRGSSSNTSERDCRNDF